MPECNLTMMVWRRCFTFSSTFNTVQPHLMGQKLLQMDVKPQLILWILSFLTDKHQKVQVNGHLSSSQVHHRAL